MGMYFNKCPWQFPYYQNYLQKWVKVSKPQDAHLSPNQNANTPPHTHPHTQSLYEKSVDFIIEVISWRDIGLLLMVFQLLNSRYHKPKDLYGFQWKTAQAPK